MVSKPCKICQEVKPLSEFHRNKNLRDGHTIYCKPCATKKTRDNHWGNRDARRRSNVESYTLKTHDLSRGDYDSLIRNAHDTCGICKGSFGGRPHLDHCHATGRLRGVLCQRCNVGLGYFKDDPVRILKAIEYLEKAGIYG